MTFGSDGQLLDAQMISQSELYQLWIEHRDRQGMSPRLTEIIRQSDLIRYVTYLLFFFRFGRPLGGGRCFCLITGDLSGDD